METIRALVMFSLALGALSAPIGIAGSRMERRYPLAAAFILYAYAVALLFTGALMIALTLRVSGTTAALAIAAVLVSCKIVTLFIFALIKGAERLFQWRGVSEADAKDQASELTMSSGVLILFACMAFVFSKSPYLLTHADLLFGTCFAACGIALQLVALTRPSRALATASRTLRLRAAGITFVFSVLLLAVATYLNPQGISNYTNFFFDFMLPAVGLSFAWLCYEFWRSRRSDKDDGGPRFGDAKFANEAVLKAKGIIDER